MSMIIWGAACTIIGASLSLLCHTMGNGGQFALHMPWGGALNWTRPLFYIGLVLAILGIVLLVCGLIKQPAKHSPVPPSDGNNQSIFCTQCGARILSENFSCPMCRHNNGLDFFLRSADPAGRAAEINHAWYKFGLDKQFRAETKELASLVVQEQRQGKNEGANQAFLAKFR